MIIDRDVPGAYSTSSEWSCPCCGVPNDGGYCDPCIDAECGERNCDDPNIETCLAETGLIVALRGSIAAVEREKNGGTALRVVGGDE